jgi:uncharacterized protein with NRDE domain
VCLLAVAWHVVPGTPLLIGANRDEKLDRPTTPFTVLQPGHPRILGGRDDLSGGTWLAVNEHGVVAGLTNQPLGDGKDPTRRSRGELPLALAQHTSAAAAAKDLVATHAPLDYNGSWLLVGDREDLIYIDFTGQVPAEPVALPHGTHVLENRPWSEPSPKVDRVTAALHGLRALSPDDALATFRRTLGDHRVEEGGDSPARPNCIHGDGYGTRSSCLIRVDEQTRPRIWVADGPPCTTPFVDVTSTWDAPG